MRTQHLTPQDRIGIREGGGNVERAEAAWELLISLLHGSHCRVTAARRIVFVQVCGLASHFSADDLVEQLARGRLRVSRRGVCRTLALLLQAFS